MNKPHTHRRNATNSEPDKAAHSVITRRCAIYTRKSSEEGLEQEFNSLDAQREACEAFILSQRHEGWNALPGFYDDGGISGGTMERPALKRLLSDIEAGRIDVVVVYKVDRLTRSLADFAKIVEIFDARGVSFVSVTQQFNTTSSMGRLTLNVLLSFAQFEREVTGERIRDKIAASKKKGMWMGGLPPLGYDVNERKLIVNAIEAQTVRHIFERYIELGSVRQLKMELDADGIVSKLRYRQDGTVVGGTSIFRGALYGMLQNRLYLGEVVHKDQCYPGEHAAIIDRDIWDRVQLILSRSRVDRNISITAQSPSLLAGLLYDETGERMTPSHAVKPRVEEGRLSDGQDKNCKRYRYYISQSLVTKTREATPQGRRVPAADIEGIVTQRIWALLADRRQLFDAIAPLVPDARNQQHLLTQAAQLSRTWLDLSSADMRKHLLAMVAKIVIHDQKVDIHLSRHRLVDILEGKHSGNFTKSEERGSSDNIVLTVQARLRRAGVGQKLFIDGPESARKPEPDSNLIGLIARAHDLQEHLLAGNGVSLASVAALKKMTGSSFTRLIRLTFLAPDIIRAILDGRHPPELSARRLLADTRFPLDWDEQRKLLGFI
jgi:DNA invertase Pin-like site-specific DNA recombinase